MSFLRFLKDKWLVLLTYSILMLFTIIFLRAIHTVVYPILFLITLYTITLIGLLLLEYIKKHAYYKTVQDQLQNLDQKYLLCDIISQAHFQEGELFYEILRTTTKSMNDHLDAYQMERIAYQEYIEMWVHEIKTPIASAKLLAENHKDPITCSMAEEIDKIEIFVEQVLFYSKSNTTEKDYIIKSLSLQNIVNKVIKKYASAFISLPIQLSLAHLDYTIYSDAKWLEFILSQILGNSIKYLNKEEKQIKIFATEDSGRLCLHIEDNGIGIVASDLSRVFDKGFTGENGRIYGKSTGIGLYLCKKLCLKLGLELTLSSVHTEGTRITLIFPKSKMFLLES